MKMKQDAHVNDFFQFPQTLCFCR